MLGVAGVLWGTACVTQYTWAHRVPGRQPLPDLIHRWVPYRPAWEAYRLPDVLLACVLKPTLWRLWRWERPALQRIMRHYTVLMGFRILLLLCTQLPDPSNTCATGQLRAGQTCGDMMFSGHTVPFVLTALSWREYNLGQESRMVQAACAIGLVMLVVLRMHYTIDVLVGAALTVGRWYAAPPPALPL